ncbi:glycosyltransferase family 2 protein [Microvirga sp. TS319]|uniref:glycosyltransferase family 2 protein n=1 Tax=Microvirga sp. TS319 TaxID=3241165 RepID=UPI00351A8AFD
MKLSIVSTLYRSAGTINEFCRRSIAAAEQITDDIEIVLVNDGSPDDSLERALALHTADPRIVVVDLARNFGHHKAMMTGLAHARGDLIFLIDCDLEEEPELLSQFYATQRHENCEVVYGVQETRRGGTIERITGGLFFSVVEALSDHKLPRNLVTARLMRRDYVRALVKHRDREFLIAHLWDIAGFKQVPLRVKKLSLSPTTYSLHRRLEMGIKYVTTTSTKLLYYFLYAGILVAGFSTVTIGYFLIRYLISGIAVDGWTSLIVSVWFFGGLTTLILGVLGIYIANILSETKRRPYTIVRQVHRKDRHHVRAPEVSALDFCREAKIL